MLGPGAAGVEDGWAAHAASIHAGPDPGRMTQFLLHFKVIYKDVFVRICALMIYIANDLIGN
jgi:hypothetical protein